MFQLRRVAFAACALVLASSPPLWAETPQDSLVMPFQIDDLITLDPAEVFEFTGAEYAANVYDRLVTSASSETGVRSPATHSGRKENASRAPRT
jgi:peptide/nickel transport system substrate-binding protein